MCALVTVDLGRWESGIAFFDTDNVLMCGTLVRIRKSARIPAFAMAMALLRCAQGWVGLDKSSVPWYSEEMQDYAGKLRRHDDLENLRRIVKSMDRLGVKVKTWPARKWKGQLPKPIIFRRIRRELSEIESRCLLDRHNKEILDAVGLGLVVSGRCGRGVTHIRTTSTP